MSRAKGWTFAFTLLCVASAWAQGAAGEAGETPIDRPSGNGELRTLAQIKANGYIRVLVRNNATSFFIYRGHRLGFDYELGKRLAQSLGIRAQFVVPRSWDDIIPSLLRGEGDIIAGEMTVTPQRAAQVLFADPYLTTAERVVFRKGLAAPAGPEDLSGKKVTARKSSSYWQSLEALNTKLVAAGKPPAVLEAAPEDQETENILEDVAQGHADYAVADELIAKVVVGSNDKLLLGPPLGEPRPLAWAVRPGATDLAAAVNATFKAEKKGPEFNIWKKQFFEAPREFKEHQKAQFERSGTLSPYDKLIAAAAHKNGFDWRLVAAQIYQESQFDPKRTSWCGAQGLFQLMPATAKQLGLSNPFDPKQSVEGGSKYMSQIMRMFDEVSDPIERYKLSLAAYNCGPGHVHDARALLKERNQPADRWEQVRPAMLELSNERVFGKTHFGYCRCGEPVAYVQKILERYDGYKQLIPDPAVDP
jgi:membrane-bound lytic murein transglycosylase F